jgi:hypothetical protein
MHTPESVENHLDVQPSASAGAEVVENDGTVDAVASAVAEGANQVQLKEGTWVFVKTRSEGAPGQVQNVTEDEVAIIVYEGPLVTVPISDIKPKTDGGFCKFEVRIDAWSCPYVQPRARRQS